MKRVITGALALLGATVFQTAAIAEGEHSKGHDHMKMEMQKERIKAMGVINSFDIESRKVNVSHGPIKTLGWPAMTMDFGVSDNIDLASLRLGQDVGLMLIKGGDGIYLIDEVMTTDGHNHSH